MNKEEVIAILKVLKVAYPKFYNNISKEDMLKTIDLWVEMFKNDNKQDITRAVKELMCELEFPPAIADIKKKINKYSDDRKLLQKIKEDEIKDQKLLENLDVKLLEQPKQEVKKINVKEYVNNIKKMILGASK